MDKQTLLTFAQEHFGTEPEYLWARDPDCAVLRKENGKWYGILMRVPGCKLGLDSEAPVDIVNVKCDPLMTGSLQQKPGFFPAYHMNKLHWISILLDGSVPAQEVEGLLTTSYYAV